MAKYIVLTMELWVRLGRMDRQAARKKAATAGIPCVKCLHGGGCDDRSQSKSKEFKSPGQSRRSNLGSVIFRRIILPFISFVVSDRATYRGTRNTVVTSHVSGDTADNSSFYATRRVGRANGY